MEDADLELALDGILWSAFGTSGQRCTATSRVIVHESLTTRSPSGWWRGRRRFASAPGWEDDTDVGP